MALQWPAERVYTLTDARTLLRTVHNALHPFRRLGDEERRTLAAEVTPLNRGLSTEVTLEQLLSLRNLLNIHLTGRAQARLRRPQLVEQLRQYLATYRSLASSPPEEILTRGAALYRLPPLAMSDCYLRELGYSPRDRRRMLRDVRYAPRSLRPALEWARAEDALGPATVATQQQGAARYERFLEDWLRGRGLSFRTQAELVEEQRAAAGRALSTPDILFPRPVRLERAGGGTLEVCWLDAKNYLYLPLVDYEQLDSHLGEGLPFYGFSFLDRQLREQAARYTAHFGPGAFVFSGGYCACELSTQVTCLDLAG